MPTKGCFIFLSDMPVAYNIAIPAGCSGLSLISQLYFLSGFWVMVREIKKVPRWMKAL
jgi:hypothetical protein